MWHYIQSDVAEEIDDFIGVTEIGSATATEQQQLIAEVEYLRGRLV